MNTGVRQVSLAWAMGMGVLMALPTPAAAGELERLQQILINERDPQLIGLRYGFGGSGLMVSHDGGKRFELLCSNAIEPNLNVLSGMFAPDGTLLAGHFNGLYRDTGDSCGWTS